ncbi:hypothetical protein JTI58_10440 [Lysinibacillus fusiformis]|uniref:hypothetical protein n=1 Tax=Lysinibacillus fusiformis TaxID=28031 RepID=UPI0019672DFD|nr:hypothetical protein [Lysinibacillus fusiformis]QSB11982.1 hypothetical protein JTI58_10440 [Lysinibacillus fusiformis]
MKKTLIGFITATTITAIIITTNLDKSRSAHCEEELEMALVKSMVETKKENEKINEVLRKISQEFNKNGFVQIGFDFSPDDRVFTIQAKDKDFIDKNKSIIENIILNIAKETDYKNFKVEYIALDGYELSEEDGKLNEVLKITLDLLKANGYDKTNYSLTIDPSKGIIIEVTNGELINKNEIEKLIANSVYSNTSMNFKVFIKEKSKSKIKDPEWQPVFSAIRDETKKEFKEYSGFAYSFHPEPLQIIIKTDLEKPKGFWQSNKKVKQLIDYVDKIIELKREELSIEEIPYEIIIRDKNNNKLN